MNCAVIFEALAARPHDDIVLRGDEVSLNAPALLEAVCDLADRLAGSRVLAVLADNGPAWVMADLAAMRGGWVHLPLPGFFGPPQLVHALQSAAADMLLTDQPERATALGLGFEPVGQWQGLFLLRRKTTAVRLPAGTAKVTFTSGSTGAPKGVCLSAAGLLATARGVMARLADLSIERHLAVLPLALLLENVAGVYAPLLRGASIHLPALSRLGWRGMAGFAPELLQQAVETSAAHSLILVPEVLKAWALHLAKRHQHSPSSLRFVAVGGARVAPGLLAQARMRGLPVYQGYGLTECGSVVSLNRPGDDGEGVGRPLDHAALRVEAGEVRVATSAFLGYLGSGTTETVAGDEFPTGDLGHLDARGHLHLDGRSKHLIVTSYGRNIAPEWVESVLLAQPEIAQAVVTGESRRWLDGILVPAIGVDEVALGGAVARANACLPDYARLGGWIAVPPFTVLNGQATGNGRPVRNVILAAHADALAASYLKEETYDAVL